MISNNIAAVAQTGESQMAQITAAATLAHHALVEVARMHQETAVLYTATMTTAFEVIQQAVQRRQLTAFEQEALYHRTMAYMFELLAKVESTGESIVRTFEDS